MMIEDFKVELPNCPNCNKSDNLVKSGKRTLKKDQVQVYLCKKCNKRFTERKLPRTSYPPNVIVFALTYFNQGHTLDQTQRTISRRFKKKVPVSTLNY